MVKYAWSTERTCAELLADLEAAGVEVADWEFFVWENPKSGEQFNVVTYIEDGDFPDDFDEEAEKKKFFANIFRTFKVGI